jgi:Flp pilus assembly protein TadD
MFALMAAAVVGLVLFTAGLAIQGRSLRVGAAVVVPLVFIFIPAAQSIPLPLGLRQAVDPNGTALLRDNDLARISAWPLSLDPVSTRVQLGRAAAALVVFLFAYHLASGQRLRHLLPRAIGVAGIAAVAVGLGHKILGVSKLYGMFSATGRTLLIGPFVNSNHTAEFLELAAFVCLGCSFLRPTILNRLGWLVGMLLCAGGAAATLSRGAVVALGMAVLMFAFLRYWARDTRFANRRRASLVWAAFLVALAVLGAGALGAGQLIDRFRASAMTSDVRFQLWRDGMRVLAAHPAGIGRGAFDHIFPIYRTVRTPLPLRFAFLESQPLQLLVDSGWLFFMAIAAAMGVALWQIARRGRRDKIEAAFIAGLFAVIVHSFVDFGLETLGVLLPFMAILGIVLGRTPPGTGEKTSRRTSWAIVGVACVGLVVGGVSTAIASNDNFDNLIRKTRTVEERRTLLFRAQMTHPLDYFYVLSYAQLEPLKGPRGIPSPRMHALNRALRLCSSCEVVHAEVARSLWRLGLRRQSLLEWRSAVELQPQLLGSTLGELFASGARPEELAAIATFNPERMVEVAAFLNSMSRGSDAFTVLGQAEALGASPTEILLLRGKLQIQAGATAAAQLTVTAAHQAGLHDPRLSLLEAQLLLHTKGAAGADEALAILDVATIRYPLDLALQRARLGLVTNFQKWQAAARALDGLKLALYNAQGSAAEAHAAGARIEARLGHWTPAFGEYRIALADEPTNVGLWIEFGHAAEMAGRDTTAREAYAQAARLSPNDPTVIGALRDFERRQARPSLFDTRATGGTE